LRFATIGNQMSMNQESKQQIFAEQVRLLYGISMISQIVAVVVGGLLCLVLRDITSNRVLIVWFAAFALISGLRISLIILYQKNFPPALSVRSWHNLFVLGTCAVAILWGATFFLMFPTNSPPHQTVHYLIVVGVVAGGLVFLCPSLPAVSGFLSLILLPAAFRMLTLDGSLPLILGALTFVFFTLTLIGAGRINRNIFENIQLRLQAVQRENILKVSEERYRHIFNNAPLGIFHYNLNSEIVACNDAFAEILGSTKEKLIGLVMLTSLKNQGVVNAIKDSLVNGDGYFEGEYTAVTGERKSFVRAFFSAIRDVKGSITGGISIVEDFTEKKLSEQQIQYHQSYDSLTGLPNRRLLNNQLSNEIARAKRHGYWGALLFIDIDNFKDINDSLGHLVGDEILRMVASRLSESIRREDIAARMGGDEFVVILTEMDNDTSKTTDAVMSVADAIRYCLAEPCVIEGRELHLTTSIGVSLFPRQELSADDILKQADTAMYRAKESGRNNVQFFLPAMQEAADERLLIRAELRQALDKGGFLLYYQPQYDETGRIIGAEALLRWRHPERGMISPAEFLPVAEETLVMADIEKWVVASACGSIQKWKALGYLGEGMTISVNISGKEIADRKFVENIKNVILENGTDPYSLGIEITESSLISISKDVVKAITDLRNIGIKFSIDDFGTGYSCLSYLQSLPLHTLKIDRSFVSVIGDRHSAPVLVDTIIMMAGNLGLQVIAEGVENRQELDYLKKKGCTKFQGYYFSEPVPEEKFLKMLSQGDRTTPPQ
jgi:diguanylate cyclase (GGDEF)-like protein/PAS domain S-box-containing protein